MTTQAPRAPSGYGLAPRDRMAGRQVVRALVGSITRWPRLYRQGRLSFPRRHVGTMLLFADGADSVVFRETVLSGVALTEPCVLVVEFRLRLLGRASLPHAMFRAGSIVNTPLFAGFDGFATKLWLADLGTEAYRGVYDWNGADAARRYAEPLCALLRLVSVPGSVRYHVVAGVARDAYLTGAAAATLSSPDRAGEWWQLREPVVARARATV